MIEINKNPSRRELWWFGALFALFFGLVGTVIWFKFDGPRVAMIIWGAAASVTAAYYAIPAMRRPLYLGWMYAAFPIGWTVSHVILALIYYALMTPIGLIMRLAGRDQMQRRLDPEATTYWIEHRPGGDPERYFRQF